VPKKFSITALEHELYHIVQSVDEFGAPKFNRDTGMPTLTLRGHDVEEFVGVVRRYGARACGTCILKIVRFGRD